MTPDQESKVSSNTYSLLQTFHEPWWQPLAIYAADIPVSLVLWGRKSTDGRWWLMRLMVDARHQGHGYGGGTLSELIDRARAQGTDVLYLSYVPGNTIAEKLYGRLGFLPSGEILHGEPAELDHEPDEIVLCLRLAPSATS